MQIEPRILTNSDGADREFVRRKIAERRANEVARRVCEVYFRFRGIAALQQMVDHRESNYLFTFVLNVV